VHLATFIFALTYVLISLGENSPRKLDRPTAALLGAVLMVMMGALTRHEAAAALDLSTLGVLFGMMVLVAVFMQSGLPAWLTLKALNRCRGPHVLVVQISVATIIGSNLFSNVPFVLIVSHWVKQMSNPHFIWLLLALTSTFAGNLTLFGSVANVIVAQGAQQRSPLRFTDFLWAGVPITIVTTAVGVLLLWVFLALGWI
jgi:Na+/H+ antiporter NhaD/arsenite permease-like protein